MLADETEADTWKRVQNRYICYLPAGNFTSFPRDCKVPPDLYRDHDEADNHIRDAQMHNKLVNSGSVELSSLEQGDENWKIREKLSVK